MLGGVEGACARSRRVRESARAPSRARCHGNTPRPELIISCGKCGRGGRGAGRGGGGSGGGVELPRAGGPERAEPWALRRHWDPVSARPVSRGPGRLGPAGTGSSRRARWALRPPCPGTPLSRSTAGGAATGPQGPACEWGPTALSNRRIFLGPGLEGGTASGVASPRPA